jgi:hypothetical protein
VGHLRLAGISVFHGTPDDVEDAVAARMRRNRIVRSGNHRFALLVEESVLRYVPGRPEVMAAQLAFLLDALEMPGVSLGVIPFAARGREVWPLEAFTVFDDTRVYVELLSAQVTVTAPSELTLYVRAFERLARLAVYGDAARTLVQDAITALGLTCAQSAAIPFTRQARPRLATGNHVGTRGWRRAMTEAAAQAAHSGKTPDGHAPDALICRDETGGLLTGSGPGELQRKIRAEYAPRPVAREARKAGPS